MGQVCGAADAARLSVWRIFTGWCSNGAAGLCPADSRGRLSLHLFSKSPTWICAGAKMAGGVTRVCGFALASCSLCEAELLPGEDLSYRVCSFCLSASHLVRILAGPVYRGLSPSPALPQGSAVQSRNDRRADFSFRKSLSELSLADGGGTADGIDIPQQHIFGQVLNADLALHFGPELSQPNNAELGFGALILQVED